ncbi:MAG TPA: hypothetical protein VGV09_11700 [Steroidobacteraceae bacterium]|nr:hypothetical protein [Steroidobacteraceae bacterium]
MHEDERKARIDAVKQRIKVHKEAWVAWSETAAASAVHDLLVGTVIRPDQADFARKILAQDLHDAAQHSMNRVLRELRQLQVEDQS